MEVIVNLGALSLIWAGIIALIHCIAEFARTKHLQLTKDEQLSNRMYWGVWVALALVITGANVGWGWPVQFAHKALDSL